MTARSYWRTFGTPEETRKERPDIARKSDTRILLWQGCCRSTLEAKVRSATGHKRAWLVEEICAMPAERVHVNSQWETRLGPSGEPAWS